MMRWRDTAGIGTMMLLWGLATVAEAQQPASGTQVRARREAKAKEAPRPVEGLGAGATPPAAPREIARSEQRMFWLEHRARRWKTEHQSWARRGGYKGFRIPADRFRRAFGRERAFRLSDQPIMIVDRYPRFRHEGYWFTVLDPWPESWSDDWYQTDDMYIEYTSDGYYLYDRSDPEVRLAVEVAPN